ncbi:MAG: hypothetical protein L0216_18560 [Planctomycetales bacterium]|nr:hypothetical protein [Planctomycetales bacterium]
MAWTVRIGLAAVLTGGIAVAGEFLPGPLVGVCLADEPAAPGQAAPAPQAAPALTEVEKLRYNRTYGAWPLYHVEKFDRDMLGANSGDPSLRSLMDVDCFGLLVGYRNENRDARGENEPEGDYGYAYGFPLVWSFWDPAGSDTLLGPLGLLSTRRDRWRAYAFPLLGTAGGGRDGWDASVLWPLLSAGERNKSWWFRAAPLVWSAGGDWGTRVGVLPAFWYESREETGKEVLVSPVAASVSDKRFSYMAVTPLYHRYRDKTRGRGWDVGFPFLYAAHDKEGEAVVLLPIGAHVRDKKRTVDVIGPVWRLLAHDGMLRYAGIFPLVWSLRDDRKGASSFTIVPVYHEASNSKTGTQSRFLLPVFATTEDPKSSFLWVAPLNFRVEDKRTGESLTLLTPFYFRHAAGAAGPWTTLLNPLYVGWRGSGDRKFDLVAGAFWRYAEGEKLERWFALPGIYHEKAGARSGTVGFPVYWDFEDTDRGERTTVLAPILYHRRTRDSRTTLLPMFLSHEDPRRTHLHLFPLFGHDALRDGEGRTTYERDSILLAFGRWERPLRGESGFDAPWPIVSSWTSTAAAHTHVLPLFWYWRTGESWTALLPPLFGASGGPRGWTAVAPLFYGSGDGRKTRAYLFPFAGWWEDKDSGDRFGIAPFAHYWESGGQATWSVLFPLLYGSRRGEDRWSARLLWEVFAVERNGPDAWEWRMLGGFLFHQVRGDETSFELNLLAPIVRYRAKSDRYKLFSILGGLFSYERIGEETDYGALWVF